VSTNCYDNFMYHKENHGFVQGNVQKQLHYTFFIPNLINYEFIWQHKKEKPLHPEDGGTMALWNTGILQHYTES